MDVLHFTVGVRLHFALCALRLKVMSKCAI